MAVLKDLIVLGNASVSGIVKGQSFIGDGLLAATSGNRSTSYVWNTNGTYTNLGGYYDDRYVNVTGDTMTGKLTIKNNSWHNILTLNRTSASRTWGPAIIFQYDGVSNGTLTMTNNQLYVGDAGSNRYKVWHEGNDGSGSTLDADLLDGIHASGFVKYGGDVTSIGSASPFSGATGWTTTTNLPNGNALVYNSAGSEYSMLFALNPNNLTYGTILRWGYASKYLYIARKSSTWQSTDWEKISAGYADSAGVSSNLSGGAKGSIPYQSSANTTSMLAIGTEGQVLKVSSAGTPYWASDVDTDTKVTQTVTNSGNTDYRPLILGYSSSAAASPTFSSVTNTTYATHQLYVKPSTGDFYTKGSLNATGVINASGGTMSGVLHLLGSQYTDSANTGSLNLNNSDIYNVNSIKFADLSDTAAEGLQWYRDSTHADSLWVSNGIIKFTPNRPWGSTANTYTVWHSGNDGSGSTLDADLLDGYHYYNLPYLPLTGGTMSLGEGLRFESDENYFGTNLDARIITMLDGNSSSSIVDGGLIIRAQGYSGSTLSGTQELLRIRNLNGSSIGTGEFQWKGNEIWHAGNDGSGSGLDADTVDGYHAADFYTTERDTIYYDIPIANADNWFYIGDLRSGANYSTIDIYITGLGSSMNNTIQVKWCNTGGWHFSRFIYCGMTTNTTSLTKVGFYAYQGNPVKLFVYLKNTVSETYPYTGYRINLRYNSSFFTPKTPQIAQASDINDTVVLSYGHNIVGNLVGNATNATNDANGNKIDTTYLPLAGGTMTGAAPINFTENKIALNFRPNSSSYYSKVQYMTSGNEALVFANVSAVTSFIFKCGYNLANGSNWGQSVIGVPTVQMKNQSLYVNSAIDNGITPNYTFRSGGDARFDSDVTVSNNSTNAGCRMTYDATVQAMKFVFD